MDLSGIWKGYYEFGSGYDPPIFGSRVTIEMTLQSRAEEFFGHCTEEQSEFSIPSSAEIRGELTDHLVRFTKTYPKTYSIDMEHPSQLNCVDGEQQISYFGLYDPKTQSLYGEWEIVLKELDNQGFYETILQGIWLVKRVV